MGTGRVGAPIKGTVGDGDRVGVIARVGVRPNTRISLGVATGRGTATGKTEKSGLGPSTWIGVEVGPAPLQAAATAKSSTKEIPKLLIML